MAFKKILITVKTYPSISVEHNDELVCTAGIDEDGNWIRIYPIPFRKLDYNSQYRKYSWIGIDLVRNTTDFRPETYRPRNIDQKDIISFHGKVGTENNWAVRRKIVLKNVYVDMSKLIKDSKTEGKYTSLAIFKPTLVKGFIFTQAPREWNNKQKAVLQQFNFFEKKRNFEVVRKLPYKFSYVFSDVNGKVFTLMNEDWELGALFWKCLNRNAGDEASACADVKKKYWEDFVKTKDLYFYLGTTKLHHLRAPNPFIIIGTFHPKLEHQLKLAL
jgi:hypothetical protein